jgi:hypothetical protein
MDTDFQEADHVLPHASGLMVEGHEHLSPILRFANPGKNNYAATGRFETALKRGDGLDARLWLPSRRLIAGLTASPKRK